MLLSLIRKLRPGEVVGRMSGDTVLIQDAVGEKVQNNCKNNIKTKKRYTKFYVILFT
jgi:hypothetical protein